MIQYNYNIRHFVQKFSLHVNLLKNLLHIFFCLFQCHKSLNKTFNRYLQFIRLIKFLES